MPPPPPRDDAGGGYSRTIIRDLVREYTQPTPPRDNSANRRALLEASARDFVSRLSFAMDIPGQHYSGLSNQQLFEILAANGRDFGAPSRELSEHLRLELIREFSDYRSVPSDTLFRQISGDIIAEWVVSRMEGSVHDVPIAPTVEPHASYKRKNGFDMRPGIMRGDLLEAVKSATAVVR